MKTPAVNWLCRFQNSERHLRCLWKSDDGNGAILSGP